MFPRYRVGVDVGLDGANTTIVMLHKRNGYMIERTPKK